MTKKEDLRCQLIDTAIVVAFVAVVVWFFTMMHLGGVYGDETVELLQEPGVNLERVLEDRNAEILIANLATTRGSKDQHSIEIKFLAYFTSRSHATFEITKECYEQALAILNAMPEKEE